MGLAASFFISLQIAISASKEKYWIAVNDLLSYYLLCDISNKVFYLVIRSLHKQG